MTGLQELEKMIRHFRRAHLCQLTMSEALELRTKWEADQQQPEVQP